jgi:shikimate kinase
MLVVEPLVLALGGGAIEDSRTRDLLLDPTSIHLVNLEASLETTLARCGPADSIAATRPVLADRANVEKRYQSRLPLYRQSHQTVLVDLLTPHEVAEAILRYLQIPSRI